MTVSSTQIRVSYTGDGSSKNFAIPYLFYANTDLSVLLGSVVQSSGYSISGAGTGSGTASFVVAPAIGVAVQIILTVPLTQLTNFVDGTAFPSATIDEVNDRAIQASQRLNDLVSRALRAPDGDVNPAMQLAAAATRANTFLTFDSSGNPSYAMGVTPATLSQATIGALLYPRTLAEVSAGVMPVNYAYAPIVDVNRYGNFTADNSHDDTVAWQNAIAVANALGGARIVGLRGRTSKVTSSLLMLTNVIIDLENGTINSNLTGTGGLDYGAFRLRSNAHICNGTINVLSSGSVGSQTGIHACINVGPLSGDGGTSGAPSADEGVYGWSIRNLTLSTNRDGKVCVQIIGGANNGIVENITAPSSSHVGGVVHLDWGFIGTINAADVPTSRTNFNAGTAWTTHPNNIRIRNIKCGALSYTQSDCVRLSGVHAISVEHVDAVSTTFAGCYHTAGDLGYEFALAAVKPFAHRGIKYRCINIESAGNGWGFFNDSWADNVAAAVSGSGYVPLLDPLAESDITFEQCFTTASGGASVLPGFRIQNGRGCNLIDCEATGHLWGVMIENDGHRTKVVRGRYWKNRNDGIYVNGTSKPTDCVLEEVFCDQNGQDAGYSNAAGARIDGAIRTKVIRSKFGADGYVTETTQKYGVYAVSTAAVLASLRDNYVNAVKATTGIAYVVSTSTDYGILDVFEGNRANSGVAAFYSGCNIIPTAVDYDINGNEIRKFRALRASLTGSKTPTAGTWKVGDIIFYADPVASDFIGSACVTAGSPGTWKRFGATEA